MIRIFFIVIIAALVACKGDDTSASKATPNNTPAKVENKATPKNNNKPKKDPAKAKKATNMKANASYSATLKTIQGQLNLSQGQVNELEQIEAKRKASLKGEKDKKKRQDINKQSRKAELKLLGKDLYKDFRAAKSKL